MRDTLPYTDAWYWSLDGLRLHYRDYPGPAGRPAILCLPGLTRNARDFDVLAARLSPDWRVLCADLRGRGESAYAKDPLTYVPLSYLHDLGQLIADAGVERLIVIGTSLGGVLAILLAAADPGRIAGVVINDIGPVVEENGLARVRANVLRGGSWPTWLHAARDLAARNAAIFPRWKIEDWLVFAHRVGRISNAGRIVVDFDPRIAEPFRLPAAEAGHDLWGAYAALAELPLLTIRGGLSDILSPATLKAMAQRNPKSRTLTLAHIGHAPTLDEAASVKAIDQFLRDILNATGE
jgi:pimeloyl-ACP methyl ester carboxylesterase